GDEKHDEVIGIKGNLGNIPLIISQNTKITQKLFKKIKKAAIVVQSTQNLEKVIDIVRQIKLYLKETIFFNTICQPTRNKQQEIRKLPLTQDIMIIIGAKTSANTKRLYEISKALNPESYLVNAKSEIKKNWFNHKNKIGISAGASTPDYIIDEIKKFILSM
ncbi:MAG: 4-hydroxy-3-methylbut-2-enyl diphosphate reductase, partial [Candidatus Omnitrophota bacterium]